MVKYLFLILLISFIIENIASLLTESFIFKDYRECIVRLKDNFFTTKLKYSSTCHQCTSQQLAFIFSSLIHNCTLFPIEINGFIFYFLNVFTLGRLSYLLHVIYDKFIFSQGVNLFHTQVIHQGEKIVDD